MIKSNNITLTILLIISSSYYFSQNNTSNNNFSDYSATGSYKIGGIIVKGIQFIDEKSVIDLTALSIDQKIKISGDAINKAINNLWKSKLFSDISINYSKIENENIFLVINVKERSRISKFRFVGVRKRDQKELRSSLNLIRGKVITKELLVSSEKIVRNYFIKKGFYNVTVDIIDKKDNSLKNADIIDIKVKGIHRVKVGKITFTGNNALSQSELKSVMSDTKEKKFYRIFKSSKFIPNSYKNDKRNIIQKYFELGYRDAYIVSDSLRKDEDENITIDIHLNEGEKYYFRNITWSGNTIYETAMLSRILNISKGDVYSTKALETGLNLNTKGPDITSLYMDNGYLFFNVRPIETKVENDSVDMEIRITEGSQARINEVKIKGNVKTKDRIILREIRSLPGNLFSRSDIIRTQRELSQLGYFNPEKLGVVPKPNIEDGSVDIEYTVEETQADQLELAGGYNGIGLVGKLGFSFKNFSLKNIFKKNQWTPIPSGDGQTLSLNAQSSGINFQNYSLTFIEPWLGGRKPMALSVSASHSRFRSTVNTGSDFSTIALSVGLGKRLKFPDDYFILNNELIYQYYNLRNYLTTFLSTGFSHSFSFRTTLSRNSIDNPIYPRSGSNFSLSFKSTPPYSLFNNIEDYQSLEPQEKYKFAELYKFVFKGSTFIELAPKLVLNTRIGLGFLDTYNASLDAPFNRFYMGGDGLSGVGNLDGREIIALRGYTNNAVSSSQGDVIAAKYVFELRYPVSLNPSATIYTLVFGEAGNTYDKISDANIFETYKSIGFGVRIFLPIVGQLGLDLGYRLDDLPNSDPNKRYEIHFSLGGSISNW